MNFFSSTPLSSFWIALIVAAFGGCLVLLGLWLEKGKEKSWFSNISDLRRQGSKAKWGWWILMAGIVFEVGDAIWTGYEIWQINPRNQPIFSATAFVRIKVRGTNQPNAIIPGSTLLECLYSDVGAVCRDDASPGNGAAKQDTARVQVDRFPEVAPILCTGKRRN